MIKHQEIKVIIKGKGKLSFSIVYGNELYICMPNFLIVNYLSFLFHKKLILFLFLLCMNFLNEGSNLILLREFFLHCHI